MPPSIVEGDSLDAGLREAFASARALNDGECGAIADLLRLSCGVEESVVLREDPDGERDSLAPPSLQASSLPSRYRVAGELARGGIGVVLKGRDVDLGRDVALKTLRAEHLSNPVLIRRLVEEAQIGGQLQHPGILPVYDLGLDSSRRPFFAMKLIRGRTFAALLHDRRSPSEDPGRFLSIFEQIAHAISYAHARGVIHRDLKPSNVMVGSFGEVQVVDWGLAKVLSQGGSSPETLDLRQEGAVAMAPIRAGADTSQSEPGSILGTPAYMAPEQARGELDLLDERSDVFGLGAILCEILTGRPPYDGSRADVLRQARNGSLERATNRLDDSGAPADLIALAKVCLHPHREARPRNATEVVRIVQNYLEGAAERARSAEVESARAQARAASDRRARHLAIALAGVLLASTAVGVGLFARTMEERNRTAEQSLRASRAELRADRAALDAEREKSARLQSALEMILPIEGKGQYLLLMSAEAAEADREKWVQLLALVRQMALKTASSAPDEGVRRRGQELAHQLLLRETRLRHEMDEAARNATSRRDLPR